MNNYTVHFAQGGFILTVAIDGVVTSQVLTSPGKLMKAIRGLTDELSLLPKKAGDTSSDE